METQAQDVTITYLEMKDAQHAQEPLALPEGVRIERVEYPSPELARWLYSVVGGPWRWYERLSWTHQQWANELAEAGSEIWLLSYKGTPAGYCQLAAHIETSGGVPATETEILYFGLLDIARGQGIGKIFLQTMIQRAWDLGQRHPLPAVQRVWVHTCTLDGPYALANYRARGMTVYGNHTEKEFVPKAPLSSWQAMFVTPMDARSGV